MWLRRSRRFESLSSHWALSLEAGTTPISWAMLTCLGRMCLPRMWSLSVSFLLYMNPHSPHWNLICNKCSSASLFPREELSSVKCGRKSVMWCAVMTISQFSSCHSCGSRQGSLKQKTKRKENQGQGAVEAIKPGTWAPEECQHGVMIIRTLDTTLWDIKGDRRQADIQCRS